MVDLPGPDASFMLRVAMKNCREDISVIGIETLRLGDGNAMSSLLEVFGSLFGPVVLITVTVLEVVSLTLLGSRRSYLAGILASSTTLPTLGSLLQVVLPVSL